MGDIIIGINGFERKHIGVNAMDALFGYLGIFSKIEDILQL